MSSSRRKVREVADGIYRLGSRYVNWYVVVEDSSITIVDTGLPRYWSQLTGLVSMIGRRMSDIEAVLVTHAHPDHLGNAERLIDTSAAAVTLHEGDASVAKQDISSPPPRAQLWRPHVLAFIGHGISNGIIRWPALTSLDVIAGDVRLDIPGTPRAIHTPGHTAGSTCFAFDDRDAIIVGDALFNQDPHTGHPITSVSPERFSADQATAVSSLSILGDLTHEHVLFGHGNPSHRGIQSVVEQARKHANPDIPGLG